MSSSKRKLMAADPPSLPPSSIDESATTESSSGDRAKVNGDALDQKYGARAVVGKGMNKFSDLINENIVAARYGVFATVALLTVSTLFLSCNCT